MISRVNLDQAWPQGRRSLAFDAGLALALIAAEVAQVVAGSGPAPLPIAAAALGGAAIAARRVAPLAVLAVTVTALAVASVAGKGEPGLPVLVALYTGFR